MNRGVLLAPTVNRGLRSALKDTHKAGADHGRHLLGLDSRASLLVRPVQQVMDPRGRCGLQPGLIYNACRVRLMGIGDAVKLLDPVRRHTSRGVDNYIGPGEI